MLPSKSQCAPYDFVWHVAATYGRELWGRKLIVALAGYFDGSGSHGEGVFVLAGYIMPVDGWLAFNEDWIKELSRLPSISYFKGDDCESGEGVFRGLSQEFRACKLNDVASVIEKHKPAAIYSALHWSDYKSVMRGKVPKEIDDPYYLLFFGVLQRTVEFQQRFQMYERVDFVFDQENKDLEQRIQFLYPKIKDRVPQAIQDLMGRQPIFRDDRETRPLQAADLYAWQLRRSYMFPEEARPILQRISGASGTANFYSAEQLRSLLQQSQP